MDFETLARDYPARVYHARVADRLTPLMDRVVSLNQVFELLKLDKFPLRIGNRDFSRYDWVRIVLDILQVRFTSIRDSSLLLAAEVFELEKDPRNLRISNLKRIQGTERCVTTLEAIRTIGENIRNSRDRNFHRAEDPTPYEHPVVYQALASFEAWGRPAIATSPEVDIDKIHRKVVELIENEFDQETRALQKELHRLLNLLYPEFEKRFSPKFRTEKTLY